MKRVFLLAFSFILFLWAQYFLRVYLRDFRQQHHYDFNLNQEETNLDPVEFLGLTLFSNFRGLIVDALWLKSQSQEVQENIEQLPVIYDLITSIQPNFVESSVYIALNLSFDLSVKGETAAQQWFWIKEGLRIFEKSIQRNAYHPRVWKLYRYRAHVISQKCLPNSPFAQFGQENFENFTKDFGQNPFQVMINDYHQLIDSPDVLPGLMFLYSQGYQKWAESVDDPQKQYQKVCQSIEAWQETLRKRPELSDVETTNIYQLKKELCENQLKWFDLKKEENLNAWLKTARKLLKFQWRDQLVYRQFHRQIYHETNLYLNLLLEDVEERVQKDKWVEVMEILESLQSTHKESPFLAWEASLLEILKLQAKCYDNLQGATHFYANEQIDINSKNRLIRMSNSYKKRAFEIFRKILEMEPNNKHVKKKLKNLENELKSSAFKRAP